MKRRGFVLGAIGSGAALIVGWGAMPQRSRLGTRSTLPAQADGIALNGWIRIAPDGGVLLAMPRVEMGQGVHTALPMLVAEELDLPLARVRLVPAAAETIYGNVALFLAALPFHPSEEEPGHESGRLKAGRWIVGKLARELGLSVTGGSTSVVDAWELLRYAAATARAQLLGAAALQWKLPVSELNAEDGVVSHSSGPRAHYGQFAAAAAGTPVSDVQPKPRSAWKLIGTAAPRTDLAGKVDGSARYGIDVRLPEMVYGVLSMGPTLGGSPGTMKTDAALRVSGVERVVQIGGDTGTNAGVVVLARSTWHARRGLAALEVEWRPPPARLIDSERIAVALEAVAREERGLAFRSRGDVDAAESAAARRIEAVYHAPYLAHAAMEPISCTARVAGGKVEIWASTQVPDFARAAAAIAAGVPVDAVTLHVPYLGGGFGRRLDADFVGPAVRVAMETSGRPVQLIWPREEDIRHDFYRPAGVAVMSAGLDANGLPVSLRVTTAGDAVTPRWIERNLPWMAGPIDLPDKTTSEGLFDQPYGVPNQRIAHVATHSGVPVGYWRSVGHSHNAFFGESFIDELAHAAGRDPVDFRLALLADSPRHAEVLRLATQKAGWGSALPAGRARGVALHESFGSVVAWVAEVSIEAGVPRVHRVVCAVDCGTVVNPGIVAQQIESGVIFGLSAALHGRIDIVGSAVQQQNFPDYPVLKMADAPRIETHFVPSERPPGGMGEPGTPGIGPAVANALFGLTGVRARKLPLGAVNSGSP